MKNRKITKVFEKLKKILKEILFQVIFISIILGCPIGARFWAEALGADDRVAKLYAIIVFFGQFAVYKRYSEKTREPVKLWEKL